MTRNDTNTYVPNVYRSISWLTDMCYATWTSSIQHTPCPTMKHGMSVSTLLVGTQVQSPLPLISDLQPTVDEGMLRSLKTIHLCVKVNLLGKVHLHPLGGPKVLWNSWMWTFFYSRDIQSSLLIFPIEDDHINWLMDARLSRTSSFFYEPSKQRRPRQETCEIVKQLLARLWLCLRLANQWKWICLRWWSNRGRCTNPIIKHQVAERMMMDKRCVPQIRQRGEQTSDFVIAPSVNQRLEVGLAKRLILEWNSNERGMQWEKKIRQHLHNSAGFWRKDFLTLRTCTGKDSPR